MPAKKQILMKEKEEVKNTKDWKSQLE